jgi:hypothetical protein
MMNIGLLAIMAQLSCSTSFRKENVMAITLMFGTLLGAIIGVITQSTGTPVCRYLRSHPTVFKAVGLTLLAVVILVPTAALTGLIVIETTSFFWGGCMVCSFIFGFFGQCFTVSQMQQAS